MVYQHICGHDNTNENSILTQFSASNLMSSWHLQPKNHGGMAQSNPFILQYRHLRMIAWFISISGHDNTHENSILTQFSAPNLISSWHLQPQNHDGMAQSDPFIPDKVMFVFQYTHMRMIAWFISISDHENTHDRLAF